MANLTSFLFRQCCRNHSLIIWENVPPVLTVSDLMPLSCMLAMIGDDIRVRFLAWAS